MDRILPNSFKEVSVILHKASYGHKKKRNYRPETIFEPRCKGPQQNNRKLNLTP